MMRHFIPYVLAAPKGHHEFHPLRVRQVTKSLGEPLHARPMEFRTSRNSPLLCHRLPKGHHPGTSAKGMKCVLWLHRTERALVKNFQSSPFFINPSGQAVREQAPSKSANLRRSKAPPNKSPDGSSPVRCPARCD